MTTRLASIVILAAAILSGVPPDLAHARGPSTREERARVVALAREIEQDPLGDSARVTAPWLKQWIYEVPDIKVTFCEELLADAVEAGYPYADPLQRQMMYSAAAFAIEHPERTRNAQAMYQAGVAGALGAYEALCRTRPDARSPILDDLVEKRRRGELPSHLAAMSKARCRKGASLEHIALLGGTGVGLGLGLLVSWWGGRRKGPAATPRGRVADARLGRIVLGCAVYFVLVGGALHLLEPDFDPRYRFMSEYMWSAHFLIMFTNFIALALATALVAHALRHIEPSSWGLRAGFGVLAVGAVFVVLAGVLREPLPHLLASVVALPSIILGALISSWSFRRVPGWKSFHPVALGISVFALVVFAMNFSSFPMPGLMQRAFLLLVLFWLALVAHRAARDQTALA